MLFGVGILLMVIGRISFAKIGLTVGAILVVLVSLYFLSHTFQPKVLHRLNTWVGRIDEFMEESSKKSTEKTYEVNDDNNQIMNSKIAIANGINPAGPGNSTQRDFFTSRIFRFYLCYCYRRIRIIWWYFYHDFISDYFIQMWNVSSQKQ